MTTAAPSFPSAAIAAVFDQVPEEAYGWPVLSPAAKRANIEQIRLRFEKGIAPLL